MFDTAFQMIDEATHVIVIQAENPDGDSLGSALALEELISDLEKKVTLYCPVTIPTYLRYFSGWDRVVSDFDWSADLAIIVDTSSETLLSKVIETPGVRHFLETHPVIVIDHHTTESTLSFDHVSIAETAAATSEIIQRFAEAKELTVSEQAAEHMLGSILADTLGLNTPSVTPATYRACAALAESGASASTIEERRREFMKKAPEILAYKGKLIERIEYYLEGKLALVHVPFNEIEQYSDKYNPGALIGDELKLVEGVDVGCVIKTYPDGKLTARLRSNAPISNTIAGYFGGGGHPYAAGFRVYESYDEVVRELLAACDTVFTQASQE